MIYQPSDILPEQKVLMTWLTAITLMLLIYACWPFSAKAENSRHFDAHEASPQFAQRVTQKTDNHPPSLQPGMPMVCQSLIQNGDFEDDDLMSLWNYSAIQESVARTSVPHYIGPNQSFSMVLPNTTIGGVPRSPWLYQTFVMPTMPFTTSIHTSLILTLHVGVNPEGVPEPDPLFVSLLDESGGSLLLTNPITVATGADSPTLIPPTANNNDWLLKTIHLDASYDLANYAGQTLRLYFNAPNENGIDSTRFYLDKVDLVYCANQIQLFLPVVLKG